jgi:asparagine synthase (glutamine-hydrolysing)
MWKELTDMCGFCGFTGQVVNREQVIREMAERITHRGPDSDGYYIGEDIAMGFRRLSIIDLSTGDQPLYNEDGTLVLMFNGEIYNYQTLRDQLLALGHTFTTQSDSEVLLHGFEEWREELLPKLRGMFAFAIYNTTDKSLFIARDYFGIKPMHYAVLPTGAVLFASEIKSMLAHPDFVKEFNEKALDGYLSFQYSVPEETFFKGVYCLLPSHYMWIKNGEVTTARYWEPVFRPDETMTLEQAVDDIDRVFTESVEAHRISDVEVGCFLSSGVDSSWVASYFGGQKAFTVGFDNGQHYNESTFAAELAKEVGIEHYVHLIGEQEYWDALPQVQYALDQPLADPSCVALWFVTKLAAEHVKVVLSGEGADELFGGYRIYHEPFSLAGYQKLPRVLRHRVLVCAVRRGEEAFIPDGSFAIRAGDEVYLTAPAATLSRTVDELGLRKKHAKNVMIVGGGRLGEALAELLREAGVRVKLIEHNAERCRELAERLPDVSVLCADGTRQDFLFSENISQMDAVVALTNLDEENVFICMYARMQGVPQAIPRVNRTEYAAVCQNCGIRSAVSPKDICVQEITRYVRAMESTDAESVLSVYSLLGGRVEALEFLVTADVPHLGESLASVTLQPGILLACISRGAKVIFPGGGDSLQAGDTVIVVAPRERHIAELRQIFAERG